MKMVYFNGSPPNFGDELNPWLMPKVFGEIFDNNDEELFLPIGSILKKNKDFVGKIKIVYGAGYGGYGEVPQLGDDWKIFCVRGPRTASILGLPPSLAVADPAILVPRFRKSVSQGKKNRFSFMPHFESIERGNWEFVCRLVGINFIDPRWPVERVLTAIENSEVLISEAMHGAIVADALRVPWIAIRPMLWHHWMKWNDWAESLGINLNFERLYGSSLQELVMVTSFGSMRLRETRISNLLRKPIDIAISIRASRALERISKIEPTLSSDSLMIGAQDRLLDISRNLIRDLPGIRAG